VLSFFAGPGPDLTNNKKSAERKNVSSSNSKILVNSSWVVSFKRKTRILCPDEGFFKLHSRATGRKKDKTLLRRAGMGAKDGFAANYNNSR
jgi:hypothetical protein